MNSMKSKCFNKLAAEYFVSSGCGFSFDPLIKKAAPLVTKKLAYSSTDFHGICSIFFEPSSGGKAPGYNTFVAWGKNIEEIVDVIKKNQPEGDVVTAAQCVLFQQIWDSENKDRAGAFGWQEIRERRITTRELMRTGGKIEHTEEQAMREVLPAFEKTKSKIDSYIIPFFRIWENCVGKKWTDVNAIILSGAGM